MGVALTVEEVDGSMTTKDHDEPVVSVRVLAGAEVVMAPSAVDPVTEPVGRRTNMPAR